MTIFSEFGVRNYKGEIVFLPNPTEELPLDVTVASEAEKNFHTDYFSGSFPQRTPEIYMKIRNHMLREWYESRQRNSRTYQKVDSLCVKTKAVTWNTPVISTQSVCSSLPSTPGTNASQNTCTKPRPGLASVET